MDEKLKKVATFCDLIIDQVDAMESLLFCDSPDPADANMRLRLVDIRADLGDAKVQYEQAKARKGQFEDGATAPDMDGSLKCDNGHGYWQGNEYHLGI